MPILAEFADNLTYFDGGALKIDEATQIVWQHVHLKEFTPRFKISEGPRDAQRLFERY